MADTSPSPQEGMAIGWGDKKATITGQQGLLIFMVAAMVAMAFWVVEVKTEKVDRAMADHHKAYHENEMARSKQVADFLALEGKRGETLQELLRLTNRQTAALEVIASRLGTYLRPREEYENRLRPEER